jgi:hypothetical protein
LTSSTPNGFTQDFGDPPLLLEYLPFGESDHVIVERSKGQIAIVVIFNRGPSFVVAVAIRLNHQSLVPPEKVDLDRAEPDIDFRARKAMTSSFGGRNCHSAAALRWLSAAPQWSRTLRAEEWSAD